MIIAGLIMIVALLALLGVLAKWVWDLDTRVQDHAHTINALIEELQTQRWRP